MMVFPYEGVYIGLVQMFHKERDTCRLEIELAVSRDTVHFTRVGDRAAFIPVGPEGSWDRFNNSLPTNPPLPVGDTLRFYYGGRSYRHSPYNGPAFPYHGKDRGESRGAVGLATIPRDRFVSMRARRRTKAKSSPRRCDWPPGNSTSTPTPPGVDPSRSARPGWSRCRAKQTHRPRRARRTGQVGTRQPGRFRRAGDAADHAAECGGVCVVVPVECTCCTKAVRRVPLSPCPAVPSTRLDEPAVAPGVNMVRRSSVGSLGQTATMLPNSAANIPISWTARGFAVPSAKERHRVSRGFRGCYVLSSTERNHLATDVAYPLQGGHQNRHKQCGQTT